jgi:ribonucleoside-triphosphate reductase
MNKLMIEKRNGDLVPFDRQKIITAINKAFIDVDGQLYEDDTAKGIADDIERICIGTIPVETIQDMVESYLMKSERPDVARAYVRYRYRREVARTYSEDFIKAISEKLAARNIENQNANVDEHSFGGRKGEAMNLLMKQYALDFCISPKHRDNHLNNRIYIHDLDAYAVGMHNCLTIPFDDLLEHGFNTRQTDVRPANSINTAMQLVAVIFQLQSLQQFGGVSASHLDWTMVPYVRKSFAKHFIDGLKWVEHAPSDYIETVPKSIKVDSAEAQDWTKAYEYAMEMTKRELKQAVEGMYHNLNTLQSRSGNQLPFTSINYGTCTLPEGRMVIEALIKGSIAGVGKLHRTPIFPCGIFQCMKGVNRAPGDPNYDLYRLALESTAKRLYPNYANVDWSGNAGYDVQNPATYFSTMGCRTANGLDVNGLGQLKDGRGNIAPATIILPTLAMEAKEKEGDTLINFFEILKEALVDARDELLERFEYICSQPAASAKFMYENHTMAGYIPEEGIRSALKHGTLVIGQLGMAETLEILIGTNQTTKEGMDLAKKIESVFKETCAKFKQEEQLNFGVYYTPAENLCYTAMNKFKAKYGEIKNVSDHEYFTNSIHIPVWEHVGVLEKIELESQLTGYSNAGCITYVELDSAIQNNLDALDQIVQFAMDHDIPYLAINVPNDTCLDCGYTGEFNDKCPECGSTNIQQLRRVTGYLTGNYKTAFNWGKQKETEARVKHVNELKE